MDGFDRAGSERRHRAWLQRLVVRAHPEIHDTARLAGDAPGAMTQGESSIIDGAGSQTGSPTLSRWGDYGDLVVDPSDDCTFWYTAEPGAAQTVSLSASRAPTGVTVSLSPATVTSGQSSTLTLATTADGLLEGVARRLQQPGQVRQLPAEDVRPLGVQGPDGPHRVRGRRGRILADELLHRRYGCHGHSIAGECEGERFGGERQHAKNRHRPPWPGQGERTSPRPSPGFRKLAGVARRSKAETFAP